MSSLSALIWLTVVVLIIVYWRRALGAKDVAFRAAERHCLQMEVQMLDQSVYLRRLWIKRASDGRLCLWRAFYFEFTATGEDRYQGRVVMLGSRVEAVQLEPHRMH